MLYKSRLTRPPHSSTHDDGTVRCVLEDEKQKARTVSQNRGVRHSKDEPVHSLSSKRLILSSRDSRRRENTRRHKPHHSILFVGSESLGKRRWGKCDGHQMVNMYISQDAFKCNCKFRGLCKCISISLFGFCSKAF
jgi:hypothetical protein